MIRSDCYSFLYFFLLFWGSPAEQFMRSYAVIPDSNQVSGFETEHVQISQRSVGSWNFQSSGKLQ